MKQGLQVQTLGGAVGLVTLPNLLGLSPAATPDCLNVKFEIGETITKRLGSTTINSVAIVSSAATGFTPDSGGTLGTNLQAFWTLNEQAGDRLDAFATNDLTDINTVSFHTGKLSNAALFVAANSEALRIADVAALSAGTGNFMVAGWAYMTTTKVADMVLASKWSSTNTANREYKLAYEVGLDRFTWSLRSGTAEGVVVANTLGAPSTATWYFLAGWHDSATGIAYLRVNTMVANSLAFAGAMNDGAAPFQLGVARSSPGFQMDSAGNLQEGLVAYWPLEEASGTRIDATGRGNNLTDNNTTGVALGKVDSAVNLVRANSNYLSIGSTPDLNTGNVDFTWAGWVFVGSQNLTQIISSKRGGSTNEWYLTQDAGQVFQFVSRDTDVVGAGSPTLNTWHFVVCWQNTGDNTINISVNTSATASTTRTGTPAAGSSQFEIGRFGEAGGGARHFLGRVDEVGFWKRVLTAGERSDLFRATSGNRFSTDYFSGRLDEWGVWKKAPTNQEIVDLVNSGNANTYSPGASSAGFGSFDFGATNLQWHVVAAGSGIYASSNRGVSYLVIATDRGANYQYFERSKNLLIATSETQNRVLYWAGSVGTFMLSSTAMPPVKHALDFGGFLLLMNNSGGNGRTVYYNDNNAIATGPFTTTFAVDATDNDEITGGIRYNTRAYIFTKYTTHQVSAVGGNPDFSVRSVKNWGMVPRTFKRVSYTDVGEVIIGLGWDKKVRIFDGSEDRIVSTPIEQPNGITDIYLENLNEDQLPKCHAELDTNEQVYRLWVVMSPSTEVTHAVCLNLRTGAWYPYTNSDINTAVMADSANTRALLAVKRDGFVYILNSGNTDAGVPINEYYTSRHITGPTGTSVTKHHDVALYFQPTSSGMVYYQDAQNFQRSFSSARDFVNLTGDTSQLQVRKVIDIPLTDNVYQFRLSSSSSTADPWRLTRVELDGKVMGQGAA